VQNVATDQVAQIAFCAELTAGVERVFGQIECEIGRWRRLNVADDVIENVEGSHCCVEVIVSDFVHLASAAGLVVVGVIMLF